MGSICRLCLHKNDLDVMKNVFEFTPKYFDMNITDILYWIFNVEIIVEDAHSKLICYKCMNVIESVGKHRQFFQVNQTFLHEKRCPPDYEVMSGWFNTRDIGTNTDFISSSKFAQKFDLAKKDTLIQDRCEKVKQQDICDNEVEWVNVPFDIFTKFKKPGLVENNGRPHDQIDVPAHIFQYYSPSVILPAFQKQCSEEGVTKVGKRYYTIKNEVPKVKLKRLENDEGLLKKYKRKGKFTFKKISVRIRKKCEKKRKLICDYYYSMPTSALRELISETNTEKLPPSLSITSLVKTNEIHVHVCEYCSKVFQAKQNLQNHYLKIHRKLLKDKYKISYRNLVKKLINSSVELDVRETSSDNVKSDKPRTSSNKESNETINDIKKGKLNGIILKQSDSLPIIASPEHSPGPSGSQLTTNASHLSGRIRVKDVKQLLTSDEVGQVTNNDYHIDYVKTVIFGKNSELKPSVSYYSDNSNLKEHDYAHPVENKTFVLKNKSKIPTSNIHLVDVDHKKVPCREKVNPKVATLIAKRFDDIRKTREELEKMKKIRFALYNEVEHCNIKACISALEEKLQITEEN